MTQTTDLGHGAALTLTEAAEACGVSRSTIKRRLSEFEHAYQDRSGWRVPVSDLLGAGLHLRPRPVTQVDHAVIQPSDPGQNGSDFLRSLEVRIEELTADLVAERTARQIAEVRAAAYAANLDDLRLSLRALSGPPLGPGTDTAPQAVRVDAPAPERLPEPPGEPRGWRSWLRRPRLER